MKFFFSKEDENSPEGIRSRMKKEKMLLVQRLIDEEEYARRIEVLEVKLAEATGEPVPQKKKPDDGGCMIFSPLTGKAPAAPSAAVLAAEQLVQEHRIATPTVKERLEQLEELKDAKLISEEEYQQKRTEILSQL